MATKIWAGTDDDWGTAGNWSPSGVPVNGDDVYFEDSSQDVASSLGQSGVTLDSLNIAQSYTGSIGSATNYLQIGATVCKIGYQKGFGTPLGSARLKIDLGTAASNCTVFNTHTTPTDANKGAVQLLANSASTDIEVKKGKVSLAADSDETTTIDKMTVSYDSSKATDARVTLGVGVDLADFDQTGGIVTSYSDNAMTTVNCLAGTLTIEGDGTITTLNASGGAVTANGTGTITTATAEAGGVIDWTKSGRARTVTNCKVNAAGSIKYSNAVTYTNGITTDDTQVCIIGQAV